MAGLVTYHLRITMEAQTAVGLGEHKGAALRGALIGALRRHYCTAPALSPHDGARQAHVQECPACRLVAAEDVTRTRGLNPPRAYVIDPPLDPRTRLAPGDRLVFGLGLMAEAAGLYPYLLTALSMMGDEGLGQRLDENGRRRGRLELRQVEALNPLTRERAPLLREGSAAAAAAPLLPVTHDLVLRESARWPIDRITVRFLTPTRIISAGRLVHQADFEPFIRRLLERICELWQAYGDGAPPPDAAVLAEQAQQIKCLADETQWIDLTSISERTERRIPIGGFVGSATYVGNLATLMSWLLWGQCLHVGKNAVKGDGWYELLP